VHLIIIGILIIKTQWRLRFDSIGISVLIFCDFFKPLDKDFIMCVCAD